MRLGAMGCGFAAGCEAGLRPAVELKIGMGYALGLNRGHSPNFMNI